MQGPDSQAESETAGTPVNAGDGTVKAALGDRGTGKSTLVRKLALSDVGPGALVIYSTPNGSVTDPWPGPDRDIADRETRLPYTIAFRGEDPDEVAQFAIDAATMPRGDSPPYRVTLIVDEAHEVYHEHFGEGPRSELFHRGRHSGIRLWLVSQWPARIDKRVFRASGEVYWFRLHASEDLWWIEKRWGENAAREIASLQKFQYLRIVADELPESWRGKYLPARSGKHPPPTEQEDPEPPDPEQTDQLNT